MSAPKPASLLGLPRELRDDIWTWTIADDAAKYEGHSKGAVRIHALPSLLHVNRQIRHEASPIFFKQNFEVLGRRGSDLIRTKRWIVVHAPTIPVGQTVKMRIPLLVVADERMKRQISEDLRRLEQHVRTLSVQTLFEFSVVDVLREMFASLNKAMKRVKGQRWELDWLTGSF